MPKKRARVVHKSDRVLRSHVHFTSEMEGQGNVDVVDMEHESGVQQDTQSDQDETQLTDQVQPINVEQEVTAEISQHVPVEDPSTIHTNDSNQQPLSTGTSTVGQQSQFMIEVGGALIPVSFQDWLAYQKLQQEEKDRELQRQQEKEKEESRLALEREKEERKRQQEEIERVDR